MKTFKQRLLASAAYVRLLDGRHFEYIRSTEWLRHGTTILDGNGEGMVTIGTVFP